MATGEMAQQENPLDREKISCKICLCLLKDPVTTNCGHNFCMKCITSHWDNEVKRGIYICPMCGQTFKLMSVLVEKNELADIVEEMNTRLQAICSVSVPADHSSDLIQNTSAGADTGHLKAYFGLCFCNKKMKMFCRTDQQCICYLCSVDEHKDHDTVTAAAERTERQRELGPRRQTIQQRLQDREKDEKLLHQEEEAVNRSADKVVEDSEKIFTELIHLLVKRSSDVKQQIRSQQETEVSRNSPSLSLRQLRYSSRIGFPPLRNFEDMAAAMSQIRDRQDLLSETEKKMFQIVSQVDVLLPQPEHKTRADFLKYSQEITLDPNTANTYLLLSEGNRKVTFTNEEQFYSHHPDRFTDVWQVLSRESLTGRCYWEMEVERGGGVEVAVTYKNINRAGSLDCRFGLNDKSWMLDCYGNSYNFYHNSIQTPVSGPPSSRVGVYLDHSAGVLSLYRVSDTMTLLHRVRTTFTQPLYAGVGVYNPQSTAEFCKLKET